jgi:hypothetical protein
MYKKPASAQHDGASNATQLGNRVYPMNYLAFKLFLFHSNSVMKSRSEQRTLAQM